MLQCEAWRSVLVRTHPTLPLSVRETSQVRLYDGKQGPKPGSGGKIRGNVTELQTGVHRATEPMSSHPVDL